MEETKWLKPSVNGVAWVFVEKVPRSPRGVRLPRSATSIGRCRTFKWIRDIRAHSPIHGF
jgi:hypothetical protein